MPDATTATEPRLYDRADEAARPVVGDRQRGDAPGVGDARLLIARFADEAARAGWHVTATARHLRLLPPPSLADDQRIALALALHVDDKGCIAAFGGLIQEFDDTGVALCWMRRVMRGECRLRIDRRGTRVREWTLQTRNAAGDWRDVMASGTPKLAPDWLLRLLGLGAPSVDYIHIAGAAER